MKIDSLMVLACTQSSLPMMLKLVSVMVCPVCCMCAWMGEGCLRCSLLLSPRVLAVSPMYSSSQAIWLHWKLYMTLLFISFGSWSLDFMSICFMVVLPLKWTCMPYLTQRCLILSAIPLVYCMTTCPTVDLFLGVVGSTLVPWLLLFCIWLLLLPPVCVAGTWLLLLLFWLVGLLLLWSSQLLFNTLFCTLLMAKAGQLHFPMAFLRYVNSFWKSSGSVQTVLALWVSVPMTLYLAERLWWLSHC